MYKTDHFRGQAQESITLTQEVGGDQLFQKVKDLLISEIQARGIPAAFREDIVKSGGMLFGTQLPILVISNPGPGNRYFDIGVFVNGNTISFPLLGESAENTKANKKQFYLDNGNYFKAMMVNPDELKLQQEYEWEGMILSCFNDLVS